MNNNTEIGIELSPTATAYLAALQDAAAAHCSSTHCSATHCSSTHCGGDRRA